MGFVTGVVVVVVVVVLGMTEFSESGFPFFDLIGKLGTNMLCDCENERRRLNTAYKRRRRR